MFKPTTSVHDNDLYFKSISFKDRSDDDNKLKCEGLVTYDKCLKSLNEMKNNKFPDTGFCMGLLLVISWLMCSAKVIS